MNSCKQLDMRFELVSHTQFQRQDHVHNLLVLPDLGSKVVGRHFRNWIIIKFHWFISKINNKIFIYHFSSPHQWCVLFNTKFALLTSLYGVILLANENTSTWELNIKWATRNYLRVKCHSPNWYHSTNRQCCLLTGRKIQPLFRLVAGISHSGMDLLIDQIHNLLRYCHIPP